MVKNFGSKFVFLKQNHHLKSLKIIHFTENNCRFKNLIVYIVYIFLVWISRLKKLTVIWLVEKWQMNRLKIFIDWIKIISHRRKNTNFPFIYYLVFRPERTIPGVVIFFWLIYIQNNFNKSSTWTVIWHMQWKPIPHSVWYLNHFFMHTDAHNQTYTNMQSKNKTKKMYICAIPYELIAFLSLGVYIQ